MTPQEYLDIVRIFEESNSYPRKYVSFKPPYKTHLAQRILDAESIPPVVFTNTGRTYSAEMKVIKKDMFISIDFIFKRDGRPVNKQSVMFAVQRMKAAAELQKIDFDYLVKLYENHHYNDKLLAV